MPKPSLSSQLNAAIEAMLAGRRDESRLVGSPESPDAVRFYCPAASTGLLAGRESGSVSDRLKALVAIAEDLRRMPQYGFYVNLKTALERRALMSTAQTAPHRGKVRPVPEGYHTVAPYLAVKGGVEAIEFYKRAFGATEVMRLRMPDGKLGHAEIQIGKSRVMLSDEFPEYGAAGPGSLGGSPVDIHLYVEDADAWFSRAVAAGAKAVLPLADMDYGERHGRLEDPFGHHWGISTPLNEERVTQVRETFYIATPYLIAADGAEAIDFYKEVFDAKELMRLADPDGRIAHAELKIGDSVIMLSSEAPQFGRRGPEAFGGTPVKIHLYINDVDAVTNRAIAAGARVVRPVEDQFYGDRAGQLRDPFGHVWIVSTHIEDLTPEEIERRTAAYVNRTEETARTEQEPAATPWRRKGFTSVTPYLAVHKAAELIDFLKQVFDATETFRQPGSSGIMHAELRIGNSMVMLGGSPDMPYPETPAALHCFVDDVDTVYRRALAAGASSLHEPTDQEYGERGGSVKDAFGNHWYLATPLAGQSTPEGLRSVTPYLHPRSASRVIEFLKQAFSAEEIARYADEAGVIHHAKVRIGDAMIEMGEAHGPYQPMPSAIYLYVPDVDATHRRAVEAGATVVRPPADQPYGERMSWVTDPFGIHWYISSHLTTARVDQE
jgi:PhnB protein